MSCTSHAKRRFIQPVLSAILLGFFGCGGDNPAGPGDSSRIQGRVTNNPTFNNTLAKSSGSVEGAAVLVAQIQADGSLKTVSTDTVETSASGEFVVETDLDGVSGLVVVAQKGSAEWRAVVTSEVRHGATTRCQPHNDESTAEAEVEQEARQQGKTEDEVSYSDIALFVDSEVASEIRSNASAAAQLVAAIEAEAEAEAEVLTDAAVGASQSQVNTTNEAKLQAQAELEGALYLANGSESAVDAAFETYHDSAIEAYVDAGIKSEAYAKSKEASSKVLLKNSANFSASARLALSKIAAEIRARAKARACEAQFTILGAASAQVDAMVNAGVTLRAAVKAAINESQIEAAFEAYHDEIISQLQITASAHASAVVNMDATINNLAGAKVTLESALSVAVTTQAVVEAYLSFYTTVKTLVQTTLDTASEAEVNAVAELLILANASA